MSEIIVTPLPGVAGPADVEVTNPDGQSGVFAGGLTYIAPAPVITSVSPGTIPVSGGTEIVVAGDNFAPGAVVTVGGVVAPAVSPPPVVDQPPIVSPPLGSLAIARLSRDVGSTSGGTVLEITGDGFEAGAVASFGGVDAISTVFNSASSLTVTVPAHATGEVDVTVTQGVDVATLTNVLPGGGAFEYRPAPTVTYVTHDFEDGTEGPFVKSQTGGGLVTIGDHGVSVSGSMSALATILSSSEGGIWGLDYFYVSPTQPPLASTGLYQRWYVRMDQATLDAAGRGQIKLLLNRGATNPPSWLHMGIGANFGGSSLGVVVFSDANTGWLEGSGPAPNGPTWPEFHIQADTWVEFQTWYFRNTETGVGHVRVWINGKLEVEASMTILGTDSPASELTWTFGGAWQQSGTAGEQMRMYIDEAAAANGFIDPVGG